MLISRVLQQCHDYQYFTSQESNITDELTEEKKKATFLHV